jgi:hypothetical protein
VMAHRDPSPPPLVLTAIWATGIVWIAGMGSDSFGNPEIGVQSVLPLELRLGLAEAYGQACDEVLDPSVGARPFPGTEPPGVPSWPLPAPTVGSCETCGAAVPPGSNFCLRCGADLRPTALEDARRPAPESEIRFCTSCGASLDVGKPFCTQCGNPVRGGTHGA